MFERTFRVAISTITGLALTASLALSQQPPAQSAPSPAPAADAAAQAPPPPPMHRMHSMHSMPPAGMHSSAMSHGSFHGGPPQQFGEHGMDMGGFHMGPEGMWWKNPRIAERLSITADQTRRMDEIVEQSRLQLIDLKANLDKQQVMLEPLMDANPVDMAKASAQIDKVADARADLEKANAKMLLSIRGVLTPDQWTKLHEWPAPTAQGAAAPAGSSTEAPAGGGHWHGGRPGGSGSPGGGMADFAPHIDAQ